MSKYLKSNTRSTPSVPEKKGLDKLTIVEMDSIHGGQGSYPGPTRPRTTPSPAV